MHAHTQIAELSKIKRWFILNDTPLLYILLFQLTEHDDVFAQFTGVNLAGQSIISSSNNVTVTLFSDDSIALNGFVISYHTGMVNYSNEKLQRGVRRM